jgi:hypothetical protein
LPTNGSVVSPAGAAGVAHAAEGAGGAARLSSVVLVTGAVVDEPAVVAGATVDDGGTTDDGAAVAAGAALSGTEFEIDPDTDAESGAGAAEDACDPGTASPPGLEHAATSTLATTTVTNRLEIIGSTYRLAG